MTRRKYDMYCHNCGRAIDKSEYLVCGVCQKEVCTNCSMEIPLHIDNQLKREWLFTKYGNIDICWSCETNSTKEFLKSLPPHQLPLLINETWDSNDTEKLYKDLLKGETV